MLLEELNVTSYTNLAMCRSCLEKTIDVSGEVLEHDYRDVNQPNIRFTVEPKCVQCQVKFTKRKLDALVYCDSTKHSRGSSVSKSMITNTGSTVDRLQWLQGLTNTINAVEIVKNIRNQSSTNNNNTDQNPPQIIITKWIDPYFLFFIS